MHFPTFAVSTTNIFPLSNSTQGGQLVTEFNLRSREMVATSPDIKYEVGPSYTHSMDDFQVTLLSGVDAEAYDSTSTYSIGDYVTYNSATYICISDIITPETFTPSKWTLVSASSNILQVAPGRAVINGHYVQTMAPMIVDMALANAQLALNAQSSLTGSLSIGIKSYYSTESTMAGSMLIENEDNTYTGVQLVVLPTDEFITPKDSPDNFDRVTADLKLADFVYLNGQVTSIIQNEDKITYLEPSRITDVASVLDDNFISKKNLNPKFLYTFSGQGGDAEKNTWCNSTGSLMVWDDEPTTTTTNPNEEVPEAIFTNNDPAGYVHLLVPHQQIDRMTNTAQENLYYNLRDIVLPKANFTSGSAGTVDANYTNVIKGLQDKLSGLQSADKVVPGNGSMIMYVDIKSDDFVFPPIKDAWENGDYILVREDTAVTPSTNGGSFPSTIYKIIPGFVTQVVKNLEPDGVQLGETVLLEADSDITPALSHLNNIYSNSSGTSYTANTSYVSYNGYMYKCIANTTGGNWDSSKWEPVYVTDNIPLGDSKTLLAYNTYRGNPNSDYFKIHTTWESGSTAYHDDTFYSVYRTSGREWSNYILLNGGIPLASTTQLGGFYNTDGSYQDAGYVTLDENGRLKLIDYGLLRSGALAYQLGEDFTLPATITLDVIQETLDNYVNDRVAFPFISNTSSVPSMINVYITLPEDESTSRSIYIRNIDSRFGTGVYLHFLGNAGPNTVVNIMDCEKIRIDSNIAGSPVINVYRSNIYYDTNIFNYIRTCDINGLRSLDFTGFMDIELWYDRFESTDPNLLVNGMEVSQPDTAMASQDIVFWNEQNPNDNHYSCALRSITFSGSGKIIGCSVYASNGSSNTSAIQGRSIFGGSFVLPQGSDLTYPVACLNAPLKVTGTFTAAYKPDVSNWVVMNTTFSMLTGTYSEATGISAGTVAFDCTTSILDPQHVIIPGDVSSIDGWEPGSYHIFYGGTTN